MAAAAALARRQPSGAVHLALDPCVPGDPVGPAPGPTRLPGSSACSATAGLAWSPPSWKPWPGWTSTSPSSSSRRDATLALIELKQPPGADADAVAYRATDFAAVAHAMGVPAAITTTSAQLRDQLTAAPRGPFLVDARIDRRSYRHVPQAIRGGSP